MPDRTSPPWLLVTALTLASCVPPPARSVRLDPAWDDARACVSSATWIDRVEGDLAVAIGADGHAATIPLGHLPRDVRAGSVLVDGVPSPRCAARIRAYGRALRGLNVNAGDTSNALRLQ
ncbi:MAG: DUF3006 domain-containing protein [Deltaproteobacteria bacterium]|nr:MAG: DUF3006 domain-containing protein [Deltaproteobacteria bacterium]